MIFFLSRRRQCRDDMAEEREGKDRKNLPKIKVLVCGRSLKENIHRHGRQFTPEDLCKRVTGRPLTQKPYVDYLTKKYRGMYRL